MFRLSKPAHSSKAQRVFGVMTSWESCVYSVISQTCLCWLFHFICHADSRGRLRSWRSVHIYGIAINKRHKKKGRAEETVWSRDDVGQQFEDSQKLFLQSVVFICSTEGTIINKNTVDGRNESTSSSDVTEIVTFPGCSRACRNNDNVGPVLCQ